MSHPYEIISYPAQGDTFSSPLLFVHGAWHGAWCWDIHFLPYFAACGFDVAAFSLRGHGKSDGKRTLNITRLSDYVDDLRVILAGYNTPPVLIGHSMGGLIIQHMLRTRKDIPAAVLLAPIPVFGTGGLAWRTAVYRPRIALKVLLQWDVYALVAEPDAQGRSFFSPAMPPDEAEGYMRRFTHESFPAVGIDALFLNLPNPRQVHTPMLVIGGEHDTLFTPQEIRHTARAYNSEAVIMPHMGHELMLDPGWEQVAALMLDWLKCYSK